MDMHEGKYVWMVKIGEKGQLLFKTDKRIFNKRIEQFNYNLLPHVIIKLYSCYNGFVNQNILISQIFMYKKIGTRYLVPTWWAIKDSNLGPSGYEPDALTN